MAQWSDCTGVRFFLRHFELKSRDACKGKCNVVEVLIPDKVADAVKNALGRNKPQGNGTLTTDGSNNALADIRNSRRAPTENQTLDTSQTDREFFNNLQRSKDVGQSKPRTFWQKVLEFGRALIDDGNKLTPKD